MEVAKICKSMACVVFILDVLGSIFLGVEAGFLSFFVGIFSGSILGLMLLAIGEIIEQLEISNGNTYELYQLLKEKRNECNPEVKVVSRREKSKLSKLAAEKIKSADSDWICTSCNEKNSINDVYCKNCGEYK